MSIFDTLHETEHLIPDPESQQPAYTGADPQTFANEFNAYKSEPTLYPNATQYISPYTYDNWGGVTGIIASFDESSRAPGTIIDNKIDPNKIYTAELAALRSSAADQIRITKLFEKKLMEGLKDKDKFGLNENDILAMQALTSARTAVTGINKEMIGIKKNISELRLKQQQQQMARGGANTSDGGAVLPTTSGSDLGHSVLDDIFDKLPGGTPIAYGNNTYDPTTVQADVDRATGILDTMVNIGKLDKYTMYESENPNTVVLVGDSDEDTEFATYSESGELLEDYPNPVSDIVEINREGGYAKDSLNRTYELRKK
jgi:hypothetical protein